VKAKGARCLHGLPAANFLSLMPAGFAAELEADGYVLRPQARAYVHAGHLVSVRLVWRQAQSPNSVVAVVRLGSRVPVEVAETLLRAVEGDGCHAGL